MRVLCIAAHPDDEVLGCGATLAKHAESGDDVRIILLADGVSSRKGWTPDDLLERNRAAQDASDMLGAASWHSLGLGDQRLDAHDRLDITQALEQVIARVGIPDIVYTHHKGDLNLDHRITHEVVLTALRPTPGRKVKAIYGFEVPSSTEWGIEPFVPTRYVDLNGTFERKIEALGAYEEEMRQFPHPRSIRAIEALAHWRGACVGVDKAEAFTVIREVA